MKLRIEYISGQATANEWSGPYGYRDEVAGGNMEMYAVVKLMSEATNFDFERIAKLLLDEVREHFFSNEDTQKNTLEKLEDAIWKMKSRMEMLLATEEEVLEKGIDIESAITVFDGNFCYLAVIGESKVYIFRDGNFAELSSGLIDSSTLGFVKTGSLSLFDNDHLFLSTSKISEEGEENVQSLTKDLDLNYLNSLDGRVGLSSILIADENESWIENEKVDSQENIVIEDDSNLVETKSINLEEVESDNMDVEDQYETVSEFDKEDSQNTPHQEDAEDLEDDEEEINSPSIKERISTISSGISNIFGKIRKRNSEESIEEDLDENESSTSEDEDSEEIDGPEKPSTISTILNKIKTAISALYTKLFKNNKKTYANIFNGIITFIQKSVRTILKWFKEDIIGTSGDRRDRLGHAKKMRRNRIALLIACIVLVILLIVSLRNRDAAIKEQERIDNVKSEIAKIVNKANSLNLQSSDIKTKTEQEKLVFVDQLDKLNDSAEQLKQNKISLDDISKAESVIQKAKDEALLVQPISIPQIVSDSSKTYQDSNVTDIAIVDNNLYLTDSSRNVVYKTGLNVSSTLEEFATQFNQPYLIMRDANNSLVVFDKDPNGAIKNIDLSQNGKVTSSNLLTPGVIGTITKATIFSVNNAIYELHTNYQQIFKREDYGGYQQGGAIYVSTNPPNWKTDPELASAIDIAAPYEIYVLIKDKGIRRYLGGGDNTITQSTFKNLLKTDFDSLPKATCFDVGTKYMAVCDPTNSRVLLFEIKDDDQKSLEFKKQFVYRGSDKYFTNFRDLVINENGNSIFVLDGNRVVRLDF